MKLYKALKLKKKLVGEVSKIKEIIRDKNSFIIGSNNERIDLAKTYSDLQNKINELLTLKFVINEANREIQSKIYELSELKGLIVFWQSVSVVEGKQQFGYGMNQSLTEFNVHFNEEKREEIINLFQVKIDAIQEDIDVYNYTTEILLEGQN